MFTSPSALAQIPMQLDTIPLAFRCSFVVFLLIVALLMDRKEKPGARKPKSDPEAAQTHPER